MKKEPMKKKNNRNLYNQKGQLSVFLGMALIILITLLAFIINVGLFVKAKINLQNAVDAAAFAGASVQAKQLTNISYTNWEIRNVYKEWLFKYYVLGQLSMNKTRLNAGYGLQAGGKNMSFRADPFSKTGITKDDYGFDQYNFPAVCIHLGNTGSEFNICEVAVVPGLPRFDPIEVPGIADHQEVFLDSIVKTKAANCSIRTKINFSVAMIWAYGTGKLIYVGAPEIAARRPGAWVKAFELGIRVRNLEMFLNRPAITEGICATGSCAVTTAKLDAEYEVMPINERPIKAFWSAYRNLNPELQQYFVLHELKPATFSAPPNTLSSYLIPPGATISGQSVTNKSYVDLQIYPVNYATYFTTFNTYHGKTMQGIDVNIEASCARTRTAIPVPGYILGFVKNPDVLTYYAVRAKTKYIGLFYPFKDPSGIELSAYASAKPFGGRIGPRIFNVQNNTQIVARTGSQYRSLPYIIGLQGDGKVGDRPVSIVPLYKTNGKNFFVSGSGEVLGGIPGAGQDVVFGIPNLLYDYPSNVTELGPEQSKYTNPKTGNLDTIQIAAPATSIGDAEQIYEAAGLYNKEQFTMFASNMTPVGAGTNIASDVIKKAMENVRRPTKYEALNYLIPTCKGGVHNLDSITYLSGSCEANATQTYSLFAPLFGPEALHNTIGDVLGEVNSYLDSNDFAFKTFINGLKKTHDNILALPAKDKDSNVPAAQHIWKPQPEIVPDGKCQHMSLAGRFHYLLRGTSEYCNIKPIGLAMEIYWSDLASTDPAFSTYYSTTYVPAAASQAPPSGVLASELHTGYMPGPRQGASISGEVKVSNHLAKDASNVTYSRRNFYSAKLVPTKSLFKVSAQPYPSYGDKPFYQEGADIGAVLPDVYPSLGPDFKNPLDPSDLSQFGDLTN